MTDLPLCSKWKLKSTVTLKSQQGLSWQKHPSPTSGMSSASHGPSPTAFPDVHFWSAWLRSLGISNRPKGKHYFLLQGHLCSFKPKAKEPKPWLPWGQALPEILEPTSRCRSKHRPQHSFEAVKILHFFYAYNGGWCQGDGSMGKSSCHKTWQPEFDPQIPYEDRRREPTPWKCTLTSTLHTCTTP